MTPLTDRLTDFLPVFLAGMAVNFEIAGIALVLGGVLGLPLAAMRIRGGVGGRVSISVIALMRAAPTFVVMFFLLNALPVGATLGGVSPVMAGILTVALSLVPYSAAYIADSGVEALQQLRRGTTLGGLLILPNVTRAFFVLVMSSGAGAAIGVPEGIAVILRHAEQLPSLGDKFVLFAIGVLFFGVPLQICFALVRLAQRYLTRVMTRSWAEPLPRQV